MSETIIVAILSLAGTVIGSLLGILASNKLVIYRIEQLEKKVEKHNGVLERVYSLETNNAVVEEDLKVINHRIDDLEKGQKNSTKVAHN
jgi:hypothetical protein